MTRIQGQIIIKLLEKIVALLDAGKNCEFCKGNGWVCENHPEISWDGGNSLCCGGAGMPCVCNELSKHGNKNI